MATVVDMGLYDLWFARWGQPLRCSQVTWQDEQFEFFEPSAELSRVFTVRLEKRILIRQEYRVAYDFFEANANFEPAIGRAARYILTGHPGIGKTCFLAYALIRRLSEKKNTVVQLTRPEAYVLFCEDGTIVFNGSRAESRSHGQSGPDAKLLTGVDLWALSDSSNDIQEPCPGILKTSALVIHVTCPASNSWTRWKREQRAKLYVMDLWGDEELGALLSALDLDVSRGQAVAQQYGPCPRIVTVLTSDPGEERYHLEQLEVAAERLANFPSSYVEQTRRLRVSDEAWSLFFVRPTAPSERGTEEIYIPTGSLLAYITQHASVMVNILQILARLPSTRMGARWIVECYMHAWLSTPNRAEIVLSAIPQDAPAKLRTRVRVGFQHTSEVVRIDPCDKTFVGDLEALEQFQCFYWCPTQGRFAGVDAVVYVADCKVAWVFQATVGEELRSTSEGIGPLLDELGTHGYDVQYKVLIFVGYCMSGEYTSPWSSLKDALKDRYQDFDDILSTRIPISKDNQRALRLMHECAIDAPDFTAQQTYNEV